MEKLVVVLQALPFEERPFVGKDGSKQVFASRKLILSDGVDTFQAEMTGDTARANKDVQYDMTTLHRVQIQMSVRKWTTKDTNAEQYANDIRIIKMA